MNQNTVHSVCYLLVKLGSICLLLEFIVIEYNILYSHGLVPGGGLTLRMSSLLQVQYYPEDERK